MLVEDAKEQEELEATTDRLMDAQEAGHESAREEGDSDGEDEEDEESEEDEDDSDDSDGEGAERPAQRRRTSDGGDSVDAGEARDADKAGSEEEEEDEDEDPYEKRKRRRRRARKAQREVKKMVESYYSETYYASTAASLTFNLACQLNRNTNSLLWLNIVALTDYLINERYTNEYYAEKVDALHREVGRLNIERDVDGDEAGEGGALAPRGRSAVVGERIEFIEEYRFMLHRWWTLYDSMQARAQAHPHPVCTHHAPRRARAAGHAAARRGAPCGLCLRAPACAGRRFAARGASRRERRRGGYADVPCHAVPCGCGCVAQVP